MSQAPFQVKQQHIIQTNQGISKNTKDHAFQRINMICLSHKKLEEAGIIKGTTLITDYDKMGYQFVAYVGLLLTKTNKTQKVIDELYRIPNVTVVHVVSGKYNIFCKIRARDTADAKDVIYKIDQIDDVLRTESMISLEESFNDKNRLMHSIFH